jgi:phospholipid/cholesterol/gamma-HCH transport system permease protein
MMSQDFKSRAENTLQVLYNFLVNLPAALLRNIGDMTILSGKVIFWAVRPPFRWDVMLHAMSFVGVGSLFIVGLTGTFTGAVMCYQLFDAFRLFRAENLVGGVISVALTRELSPVLACLMLTSRACSAMATEIGTMRVTEQIDALQTIGVSPVQYLIVPRVAAGTFMAPILCMVFTIVGTIGAYEVGVKVLGLDPGVFIYNVKYYTDPDDLVHGLIKSVVFGFVTSLIACYKGYNTTGGASGVGEATNRAVVYGSIAIFILDYFLTVLLRETGITELGP